MSLTPLGSRIVPRDIRAWDAHPGGTPTGAWDAHRGVGRPPAGAARRVPGPPAYHRPMNHAPLPDDLRAFLDDSNFATIATLDPDGTPRQAVIWYTLTDDHLVINSARGRRWPENLLRDPRISVSITDRQDGYRWVGFTGRATPIGDQPSDQPTAQADIAAMARRYHADDPDEAERLIRDRFERQERISFRVPIGAIHDHRD